MYSHNPIIEVVNPGRSLLFGWVMLCVGLWGWGLDLRCGEVFPHVKYRDKESYWCAYKCWSCAWFILSQILTGACFVYIQYYTVQSTSSNIEVKIVCVVFCCPCYCKLWVLATTIVSLLLDDCVTYCSYNNNISSSVIYLFMSFELLSNLALIVPEIYMYFTCVWITLILRNDRREDIIFLPSLLLNYCFWRNICKWISIVKLIPVYRLYYWWYKPYSSLL